MALDTFHPLIQRWFTERFAAPTEAQKLGWPAIQQRQDTLIAAPTGSGKTLTAFLASLDRLLRLALAGQLADQTYVVYVSPLRALSNDIHRNLESPLDELLTLARETHPDCQEIRAFVRTGDTPARDRQKMVRKPPHILVTTPESLYLVLTGKKSREMLRHVETVIVDEIHAVARDKRGSHLTLSLERLDALCTLKPVRVGLSATQRPLEDLACFLSGSGEPSGVSRRVNDTHPPADATRLPLNSPRVINVGHFRDMDLAIEVPERELQAVCMHEHWAEVYEQLVKLIEAHRSTLIFVNTRKMAERVAHQLTERLGKDKVLSHHGSLAHRSRQQTEQRLKEGTLKAVVATASLELGIDIGHIDLVCQLGSPRSIATFLQRIGRAGHSLGLVPKGRLFALSREELIECLALVRAAREGRLDNVQIPQAPLDILAQQIVAAVACEDWDEDDLFRVFRRAYPYRNLKREDYDALLDMLSEGIAPQRGRFGAYLHRDRVNRRLRARKGARITAITCGGAIPEIADYRVVTDDENRTVVGTLDEDFAVECNAGDIFLLGNTSWRVKHVRGGEVVVTDARGAPPSIPFWRGEAPGRTFELSAEVGKLREDIVAKMAGDETPVAYAPGSPSADSPLTTWLMDTCRVGEHGARQALAYVEAQYAATHMMPTQKKLLFERFFDESGGMQLVVHAPFGTRINRAWGLALRKRFCRSFDFELQASADDNGIVLSLGTQHSFPLEQMFKLVPSHVAHDVLVQAFLAVPFFGTRWRWNVTRALQLRRAQSGKRVPPHLQRMRAEDLLTSVFPAQTACKENVVGDIELPNQPIVQQSMHDCLHEAADFDGLMRVLKDIETGKIETLGLDSREPSPFAHELINANPYSFLDDAPLEERRARAVAMRRTLSTEAMRDLARLDPAAIAQVRAEAWPLVRDADELHDVLLSQGLVPVEKEWQGFYEELRRMGRATSVCVAAKDTVPVTPTPLPRSEEEGLSYWVATERWPLVQTVWPGAEAIPPITIPIGVRTEWPREEAILHFVRGRMECIGPTTIAGLANTVSLDPTDVEIALLSLESQGVVLRGHFTTAPPGERRGVSPTCETNVPDPPSSEPELEWCERRLLARIHRLTLEGLRQQIAPVPPEQFLRFLLRHQHLHPETKLRGQAGLLALLEQFEGYEAPAGHWEKHLMANRLEAYSPAWLDGLTFFGRAGWGRLRPQKTSASLKTEGNGVVAKGRPMKAMTRSTPISLVLRDHLAWLLPPVAEETEPKSTNGNGRHETNGAGHKPAAPTEEPAQNGNGAADSSLSGNAQAAYDALKRHGALFPAQIGALLALMPSHVDDVLGELAAAGLVTSDGYPALRTLLGIKSRKEQRHTGRFRSRRARMAGSEPAGRWTLLRSSLTPDVPAKERIEHWCWLLLKRYGVMFRDLLANESAAPPWWELVRTYRRLEARGEIRGGRFVAGVAGEQYALSEVIPALRGQTVATSPGLRGLTPSGSTGPEKPLILPGTDPLNLTGRLLDTPRVPALPGHWIAVDSSGVLAKFDYEDCTRNLSRI